MMDEDAQRRGMVGASDAPASFAAEFLSLSRRRMVITGGPGTGKTTLAVQLLLELVPTVADSADYPIPVLLAAAEWNPSSEDFHEFVRSQVDFTYPALNTVHPEASWELITRRRLIVILDGLDEVPTRRRVEMLRALNASLVDEDAVIVTCRISDYREVIDAAEDRLTGAVVVSPLTLSPVEVSNHLRRVLHKPISGKGSSIGEDLFSARSDLLDLLESGQAAQLAAVTRTPLGVWLLRSVYFDGPIKPTCLINGTLKTPRDLWLHLMEELIPALLRVRPPQARSGQKRYRVAIRPRRTNRAEDVRRLLTLVAHQLSSAKETEDQVERDWKWWTFADFIFSRYRRTVVSDSLYSRVRRLFWPSWLKARVVTGAAAIAFSLFVGTTVGLIAASLVAFAVGWALSGVSAGLAVGATVAALGVPVVVLAVGVLAANRCGRRALPARLHVRFRGRRLELFSVLARPVGRGLGFGLALGWGASLLIDPAVALTSCLVFGVAVAFTVGLADFIRRSDEDNPAESPYRSFRGDRAFALVSSVGGGLLLSLSIGVSVGVGVGLHGGVGLGVAIGLLTVAVSVFTVGLMFGFAIWLSSSASYTFVLAGLGAGLLDRRNLLFSWRMMQALDDCHQVGLLRAVGPIYQFRHAEFQDFLAAASGYCTVPPPEHDGGSHQTRDSTPRPAVAQS